MAIRNLRTIEEIAAYDEGVQNAIKWLEKQKPELVMAWRPACEYLAKEMKKHFFPTKS